MKPISSAVLAALFAPRDHIVFKQPHILPGHVCLGIIALQERKLVHNTHVLLGHTRQIMAMFVRKIAQSAHPATIVQVVRPLRQTVLLGVIRQL